MMQSVWHVIKFSTEGQVVINLVENIVSEIVRQYLQGIL